MCLRLNAEVTLSKYVFVKERSMHGKNDYHTN